MKIGTFEAKLGFPSPLLHLTSKIWWKSLCLDLFWKLNFRYYFKLTKTLTNHGFQLDSAHDEVVKRDAPVLACVAVGQDVEDVVVQTVTSWVKRLSQLKRTQVPLCLFAVDAVYRLKHNVSLFIWGIRYNNWECSWWGTNRATIWCKKLTKSERR